jgi:hypothetical protein
MFYMNKSSFLVHFEDTFNASLSQCKLLAGRTWDDCCDVTRTGVLPASI